MTRPNQSALVLDGNEVKLRLIAERTASKTPVHIDWLRVTFRRRNSPTPGVDALFPPPGVEYDYWTQRRNHNMAVLATLPDVDAGSASQAFELAHEVCLYLGEEFVPNSEVKKGHDFYKHRVAIERAGCEVGWVGFGASSESPRQRAQAQTLHVNLYGQACTFARHGWAEDMAGLIDERQGVITRCDLALDFFDGYEGGIRRVWDDYAAGVMDVNGKRPKCNTIGPWADPNGRGRSFYIGSKEGGKQTNAYEKGDQLFGEEAGSSWLRFELRYGNKLRVLSTDMLRHPADFFAGASAWHAAVLREADAIALPKPIPCKPRIADVTVDAAVARVFRWIRNTAGASVALALKTVSFERLCDLLGTEEKPGRVRSYSLEEIRAAAERVIESVTPVQGAGHAAALT